jgi:hypothetical protein
MLLIEAKNVLEKNDFCFVERIFDDSTNHSKHYYKHSQQPLTIILDESFNYHLEGKVNDIFFLGSIKNSRRLQDSWRHTFFGGFCPFYKDEVFVMDNTLHPIHGCSGLETTIHYLLMQEYVV